jgi:hypothetical protein
MVEESWREFSLIILLKFAVNKSPYFRSFSFRARYIPVVFWQWNFIRHQLTLQRIRLHLCVQRYFWSYLGFSHSFLKRKNSELVGRKWKVYISYKMEDVPVPGYQTFCTNKCSTLNSEYQTLVQQYPDADAHIKQFLKVLGDIEDVARNIPAYVGESAEWSAIVNAAEEKERAITKVSMESHFLVPCTALIQ